MLFKKQVLRRKILFYAWFNLKRANSYKQPKASLTVDQAKKEVESIEEFLYNGTEAGIWDLKGDESTLKAPTESKKKKKKSSSKKKRAFFNAERQMGEEDLEVGEVPFCPFLVGREAMQMLIRKATALKDTSSIPSTDLVTIVSPLDPSSSHASSPVRSPER